MSPLTDDPGVWTSVITSRYVVAMCWKTKTTAGSEHEMIPLVVPNVVPVVVLPAQVRTAEDGASTRLKDQL